MTVDVTVTVTDPEAVADDAGTDADAAPDAPPMADPQGTPYRRWRSTAVFEGVWTGDYRMIAPEALTWRDLPRPLMAKTKTTAGHDDAEVVGRIDSAERVDASEMVDARTGEPHGDGVYAIRCEGVFLNDEQAARVAELIEGQFLTGVSVDLTDVDYQLDLYDADGNVVADPESADDETWMGGTFRETILAGRISELTITPSEAFEGAYIELLDDEGNAGPATKPGKPTPAQQAASVRPALRAAGGVTPSRTCVPCRSGAVVASSAPVEPPRAWFDRGDRDGYDRRIFVTDEGRVFGYVAPWDVCHIGIPGRCVPPPRSATKYSLFHLGSVKTAEGDIIPTGVVTVDTGHEMNRYAGVAATVAHYDDTGTAVADVVVGEDGYGIWFSGALRPDATPEQVRKLRGSKISGDWRPWGADRELVAALAVNTPGFPAVEQVVASAGALIASFWIPSARPGLPTATAAPELDEVRALLPELRAHAEHVRAGRVAALRSRMDGMRRARGEELRTRMGVGA